MNRSLIALSLTSLLLTGCGGSGVDDSQASKSSSGQVETASPTEASPTASATPFVSTPLKSYTTMKPMPVRFTLSCAVDGSRSTFQNYRAAWDSGEDVGICTATLVPGSGGLDDSDHQALDVAYGPDASAASLGTLHSICAQTVGIPIERTVSAPQADEARGALKLCPDHPKAAQIQASIAMGDAAGAQMEADEDARAAGKLVGSGSYLIGVDVPAGTWQSVGEKVEDCYWEVSDAQGNILSNNFVSIAPSLTVVVPDSASGFTTRGCAFRWVSE